MAAISASASLHVPSLGALDPICDPRSTPWSRDGLARRPAAETAAQRHDAFAHFSHQTRLSAAKARGDRPASAAAILLYRAAVMKGAGWRENTMTFECAET
jgi:hypothetical protein